MTTSAGTNYDFGGRLRAEFPSQILVDATEVCNLACIHCPHPDFKKSHHYDGRSLDPILNEKMVEEVREHGQGITQYIRYASNGEPLTHKAIYDMMAYAARRSGTFVTLTTNGRLLNAARAQKVIDIGVNVIDISLDAFSPETYAKIRVGGNLIQTRENVLRLIEMAKQTNGNTKVVVSYVEQPLNTLETRDFESYWKDAGADYVVIRRLHSCSGAKEDLAESYREANAEPRRPCLYPWERIVINARGDLAFCPSDWVHGSVIGNYSDLTIKEVWGGEFYTALRKAHLSNDYSKHSFCGQCPDWKATKWPDQGRSYANMVEEFKATE